MGKLMKVAISCTSGERSATCACATLPLSVSPAVRRNDVSSQLRHAAGTSQVHAVPSLHRCFCMPLIHP